MSVGQIIGLFINGIVSERLGYRKTMLGSLLWCTAAIFILFFAESKAMLLAGELCIGIPLGVFQTLCVTYAVEVCPVVLRCYLTTYVNLCWVMGQLLGAGVLRGLYYRTDQWGYRIPFALQWLWPVPIAIGVALAPESPWWLVRTGQFDKAEDALKRLASSDASVDFNAKETIAMMHHTNEMEKEVSAGTSYLDCFKGVDLRRTEVSCLTWAVQNLCGAGLMGYSTYFYQNAGLPGSQSFNMSLAQYGLGFLGTLLSWVLMTHFGRRRLYVVGLWTLFVCLMIIGFVSLAPKNAEGENIGASWAIGSMLLVYTFIYDATVGPVCYSLVSEMPSTRLRNKTVVLARNLYNIFSIVNGFIIPYMLNPIEWSWGGKAGFFWAGLCFCSSVWAFFRLPEPRGRTFAELDVLFEAKLPARRFRHTNVNPFNMETGEMHTQKEE